MRITAAVIFSISLLSRTIPVASANDSNKLAEVSETTKLESGEAFNQNRRVLGPGALPNGNIGVVADCDVFDQWLGGCTAEGLNHYCTGKFRNLPGLYLGTCQNRTPICWKECICILFKDEVGLPSTPWTNGMTYKGQILVRETHNRRLGRDLQQTQAPTCLGDPHFKTWSGEKYDFHGICDLVLLQNKGFKGIGMHIHIRTKKTRQWSYISNAALRIGKDTLEVVGGKDGKYYWVNGVKYEEPTDSTLLSQTLSQYYIKFFHMTDKSHKYVVSLGFGEEIVIQTWNAFVRVEIHEATPEHFEGSSGLMGSYPGGQKVARDKITDIDNLNTFGQEWQVLSEESMIFHDDGDGPQAPQKCEIPSASELRRRLAGPTISREDAELACARVDDGDFDLCVFDVMATNDKDLVGAY